MGETRVAHAPGERNIKANAKRTFSLSLYIFLFLPLFPLRRVSPLAFQGTRARGARVHIMDFRGGGERSRRD